ncbi:unnamed protein product [Anisakis simplex]|uniref:Uncharacterized protein n=1 Tax=Anisakis simplex TaxID=6269 RepID=A0A0M3J5H0_ANISI|nr:unnamed protein product [Anisakis simplex]
MNICSDKIQLQTGGVFGRGASPDEQTFDRKGPLTIPSAPQPKQDDSFVYLDDEQKDDERFGGIAPRPPTPPKELDDEDVKPTTIDVGPRPPYKTSIASDRPRSILKHVGQGPWFDFKTIDPKCWFFHYDFVNWV